MSNQYTRQVFVAAILMTIVLITTGCLMNDNAATASMHNSDNRLATERAIQDAKIAEAEAKALAQTQMAAERTQQQLLLQHGATERLYAQSQYFAAMKEANTTRFMMLLIVMVPMLGIAGAIGVWLYCRNNPKPVPWGQPQYAPFPPMPIQIAQHPKTLEAGWHVDYEQGIAIRQRGNIIETAQLQLEDKRG